VAATKPAEYKTHKHRRRLFYNPKNFKKFI